MSFNEETKEEIQQLLCHQHIPIVSTNHNHHLDKANRDWILQNTNASVAFHIRHTDKIGTKSQLYTAQQYINRLRSIVPSITSHIDTCCPATDDETVIGELQEALIQFNMSCTLHTLSEGSILTPETRETPSQTIRLLAEMNVLADATYFIATYNSNLGV